MRVSALAAAPDDTLQKAPGNGSFLPALIVGLCFPQRFNSAHRGVKGS